MGITKFRLNYLLSEYMNPNKSHTSDPMPHLLSKKRAVNPEAKSEFINSYLNGIDFIDDGQNE